LQNYNGQPVTSSVQTEKDYLLLRRASAASSKPKPRL